MELSILKEIVQYTTSANLDLVKITGDAQQTLIEGVASDKTVVMHGKFRSAIPEFIGTLGLPNLSRLGVMLNIPEYRENAQISTTQHPDGGLATVVLSNSDQSFTNVYRLMTAAMASSAVASVTFREPQWQLEFEPLTASVQKFRYQTQALSDSEQFQTYTKNNHLYFELGEPSSHLGTFVFHTPCQGQLREQLSWPVRQVQAVLNLTGDKRMKISDAGAMQITVDSGVAEYRYIIPTKQK